MYRVVNTHFNSRSYVSRLKETITDARVTKEEVTNCGVLSPKRNRELERSSAPPRPRHATRGGEMRGAPSAHVATEPPPWLRAASLGTSGLSPATAAPAAPLGETAHPSASTQAQRAARASGEPNPLLSHTASSRPAPPLPLLLGLLKKQPDPPTLVRFNERPALNVWLPPENPVETALFKAARDTRLGGTSGRLSGLVQPLTAGTVGPRPLSGPVPSPSESRPRRGPRSRPPPIRGCSWAFLQSYSRCKHQT